MLRLLLSMLFASGLLLGGCTAIKTRPIQVDTAGTGALTDGQAINAVGDADVIYESANLDSQVNDNNNLEVERRYEYRSGR